MGDLYDKEVDTLMKMGGQEALENQYKNISRRLDVISAENRELSQLIKGHKDTIEELESLLQKKEEFLDMKNIQIDELKQRIAELENENKNLNIRIFQNEIAEEKKNSEKINLNQQIKVKLTPLGAEIYYHQYDELNKIIKENGGTKLEPRMPEIDKDGHTKFALWEFMELYGKHIGMCKPNVIEPLNLIICN